MKDGLDTLDGLVEAARVLNVFDDGVRELARVLLGEELFEVLALAIRADSSYNVEAGLERLVDDVDGNVA